MQQEHQGDLGTAASETVPHSAPTGLSESVILLRIALPLIAAYLAEFAMFVTTKIVVGRLGYHELAAVGLAGDLTFEVLVILMGLLSIVGVLVAQAEGAGRKRDAGHAARQGFIVATVLGLAATLLVWNLTAVMVWTGQDPKVVALAGPYLKALSGLVLPVLWFAVLRSFVSALARTGAVMVITVTAVGLNYLLTVGLVGGAFGLPALGVAGAGWATTIVSWVMLAALALYAYRTPGLRGYGLFRGRLRVDPPVCAEIARLGVPVAGLVVLEAGLFMTVSILSGVLGAETLAAYEILMGWVGIPFVIALGLAEATMVRVAHGLGRDSPASSRLAGLLGMAMGVVVLGALVVVPLGLPDVIARVFLEPGDPGFERVSALAARLLVIVAVFQVFDGLQAIASRALRGMKDTVAPLWLAGFGYWVLGIGGGCLLTFPLGLGAEGLWWGLALGLTVTGNLLAWRFLRLSARPLALS
ncbi:MAG: MATE family efflux transporter [Rhodospirillales bacterium]|nr:MATE family efflux transporter [Rhodospirillales bacterium]